MATVACIHHVALTVSDIERSAAWYRALFGLTEVTRSDDETAAVRVLAGGTVVVGLRQYHGAPANTFDEMRTGLDHMDVEVTSKAQLASWEQLLRNRDITFSPIAETTLGSVIVLRAPDNIQLELWLPSGR
jgi:glyoxylase I family protein